MSTNIFTVKRSEIEGRLDPIYYIRKNELVGYKHLKLEKIGKHFFVKDGDHDRLPDDAVSDENNGFRYLRAQDLKENKIISEKPIYVTKKYFESVRRCHIYPNDLLFSIMASVGATAVVPKNFSICTANRAVGILRAKNESVFLPEYVQVVLNTELGIKLLELQKRGGIQQRVNLDDISNLELPVFDFEKQRKIIDFYNSALSQKEQKQEQAKELLASIDSYLLSELGITLPQKDNSLSKRIFTTKFSEVTGGRWDAYYNNQYYKNLFEELKKSEYKLVFFHEIINDIKNGVEIRNYVDNGIRYLRVSDLSENGILNTNARYVETQKIPERIKLNSNSFLISRSGSLGLVNVVTDEVKESILSSHIFKVDLNTEKVFPEFLETFFRSSVGQFQFFRNNNGGVIPEINHEALTSLRIILPPLPKQKEIAEHIRSIRAQAKQLQAEAEQILQAAKHQVEKMILGE